MNDIPLGFLFGLLGVLIVLSGFFSGSETALMALNRYRLRHLTRSGHHGAIRASRLLERPDRLIGLILLGNNFVNILASSIATIIALRLLGEAGIAVATLSLTVVILIFSEVTPKTVAALHPERIAFPASLVLGPLLRAFYPLVWAINGIANFILRPFNVSPEDSAEQPLSPEELRTVVLESGSLIPQRHRRMLLSILDLQEATVEDIMIPSREVYGLDLEMDWEQIRASIVDSPYTRLPVYRGDWDRVVGFVHLRRVVAAMSGQPTFDRKDLEALVREPYFIPEGTPLHSQLVQFQQERRRIGMVVDEYGEMLGLATLEDILEEIVGEFTTDPAALRRDIRREADDCYLVDGRVSVRRLNRSLNWDLPTDGPRTLSGTVVEQLEAMPSPGISLMVAGHPVEIVETMGNRVKLARIRGRLKGRQPRLPATYR